jgi:hypothetical protein
MKMATINMSLKIVLSKNTNGLKWHRLFETKSTALWLCI